MALSISGCATITSCTICPQSAELTHPILCSRPGLMTPLPHSHLLTLLGWDQSWPVSGQQAHVSTPPFPSYSFISASPGCDPMGLPGPLSSFNMVLPAPPSPPSLTTGLAPQQSIVLCGSLPASCVCLLSSRRVLGQLTYSTAPLWPGPIVAAIQK